MSSLPKKLRFFAFVEMAGIVILSLSLLASKPPTYLFTLMVGSGLLVVGFLGFLWFIRAALKE